MRRQLTWSCRGAVLVVAGLLFAGCTHTITVQERTASFARYESATIRGTPARLFLQERVAVLVAGVEVKRGTDENDLSVEFAMQKPSDLGFGTASVIDSRGYLLTAAHCAHEPVFLFFGDREKKGRFERARVVWRGDTERGQADLAILHVPHRFESTLDWATHFKVGDAVLAAGLNYDDAYKFDSGCIAGELTKIERQRDDGPAHDHVYHQAPLHGGDSGGPLTTTDGRLVGINTGSGSLRIWPFLWLVARAERPDVAWLRRAIDEDFARWHQTTVTNEAK